MKTCQIYVVPQTLSPKMANRSEISPQFSEDIGVGVVLGGVTNHIKAFILHPLKDQRVWSSILGRTLTDTVLLNFMLETYSLLHWSIDDLYIYRPSPGRTMARCVAGLHSFELPNNFHMIRTTRILVLAKDAANYCKYLSQLCPALIG